MQLARHLALRGHAVTYVGRFPKNESKDLAVRELPPGVEVLDWSLATLREWLRGRDETLRIIVETPEEETLEFVRMARRMGARHWAHVRAARRGDRLRRQ